MMISYATNLFNLRITKVFSLLGICTVMLMVAGCSTPLKTPTQFDFSAHALDVSEKDFHLYVRDTSSLSDKTESVSETKGDGGFLQAIDQDEEHLNSPLVFPDQRPILFIVNRPEWDAVIRLDEADEEDVLFTLRERMYRYLLRNYPHPTRVRYAYLPDDKIIKEYRVVEIDSKVTHVTKGNGFLRFMIGYGLGAVTLQYEGSMKEIHPGEEFIGAFALRQRHAAYPNGFINTSVFKDAYCMRYAAEALVHELTLNLPKAFPPVQKPDEASVETAAN